MVRELNVISLGAGVQSSTVLLMALQGELTPFPDAAIFADTGGEPRAVYEWLDWLEERAKGQIPIHRVSQGNLGADVLAVVGPPGQKIGRTSQPPFYVRQAASDDAGGTLWRNCTRDYKLRPIRRKVRELQYESARHTTPDRMVETEEYELTVWKAPPVHQWIGISLDEAHRMKDSGVRDITNVYPLVDARMTRHDCVRWLAAHGYPIPPRSACLYCPYHSNAYWRQLRDESPDEWEATVQFDAALRRGKLPGVTGDAYLHRSFIPLAAVDLSTAADHGQIEMQFGNECEGMCGV